MNISFKRPFYSEAEVEAVRCALGGADYIDRVRERLQDEYGGSVFLTASGSAALDALFLALDFPPGSEVILPSFTYPSAANALVRCGLRPVFADIDPDTLTLSADAAVSRITPRTRAILPTHYGGASADLARLTSHEGILLIEDAALSYGALYRGRPLGSIGDAGIISFHRTKNVSAEEGGVLVISRAQGHLAARIEMILDRGTDRSAFLRGEVDAYTWRTPGLGGRMSNVHAAILDAQLDKAQAIAGRQALIARRYRELLAPIGERLGFALPRTPGWNSDNHHVFWLRFADGETRERVRRHLLFRGIDARTHYMPLHESEMGQRLGYAPDDLPVTQAVSRSLLRLPIDAVMGPSCCDAVASAIREAL
ncbi:MAG: dTDP-4-amino-4,6-dideoxygalactose transaminase [Clostridiales bacterium]|nr:dTDP-4-amino-4,6-dideoxygalactose transaminase [Clostridiales bacterium]